MEAAANSPVRFCQWPVELDPGVAGIGKFGVSGEFQPLFCKTDVKVGIVQGDLSQFFGPVVNGESGRRGAEGQLPDQRFIPARKFEVAIDFATESAVAR